VHEVKIEKAFPVACALLLFGLFSTRAETLPGSNMTVKFVTSYACRNSECAGIGSGSFKAVHSFDVDPAILAQIDATTSITINILGINIPVIFSDDPQFVSGSTSARMVRRVHFVSYVIGTSDVLVVASWADGVFTVSVAGRFSGVPDVGPGIAPGMVKQLEQINLETIIEKPGMLLNKTSANLPINYKQRYRDFRGANGDLRFDSRFQMSTLP
jgi:hypothetical protein